MMAYSACLKLSAVALLLCRLCSCPPDPGPIVTLPAPDHPKLISGALHGNRVCGDFPLPDKTYTFQCDPLPTIITTGWVLTPLARPPDSKGYSALNRAIDLKVTTPSLTDLAVTIVSPSGHEKPLAQVKSPQEPANVNDAGEFGIFVVDDDGTTRTSLLQFMLGCGETDVWVRIYNVSGTNQSSPLDVLLLRREDETCDGGGGTAPPVVLFGGSSNRQGGGSPLPHQSSCPNGGSPKSFGVCENCANAHPESANQWSAGDYCDEASVKVAYGITNLDGTPTVKSQMCSLRIEPDRSKCECTPGPNCP